MEILVLEGDGIGPEITAATLAVVRPSYTLSAARRPLRFSGLGVMTRLLRVTLARV